MSEYAVGKGGDYPTLTAAAKAVKPGDVVQVLDGVYREEVTLATAGVMWRAAEGHKPIIDGGWDGSVQGGFPSVIAVTGEGVVVDGLAVRNGRGRGIGVSASHVKLLNVTIDRTYHGAILLTGGNTVKNPIKDIEVRGCVLTDTSLSWVTETRPQGVNGCFNVHNVIDSLIIANIIRRGWGEGFNIGRGSERVVGEGNVIYSMNHVLAYLNRCTDCLLIGNWLFHLPDPIYAPRGQWSAGVVIGDERGDKVRNYPHSRGNRVMGNVVVGTGTLLHVRNNRAEKGGYDTQLLDTVIEGNTFVAGPGTRGGINIQQNQRGRPHQNSVFRNNVIEFSHAQGGADGATFGGGGGVAFAGNGWSHKPPRSMQGEGDVYGDLRLVAPAAEIHYTEEGTDFNVHNYRPWWNSPVVVDEEQYAGALPPFGEAEPEPDPEPPPPDPDEPTEPAEPGVDLAELERIYTELQDGRALIGGAARRLEKLIESLKV